MKRAKRIILRLFIMFFVIIPIFAILGSWYLNRPVDSGNLMDCTFQIERGESYNRVALRLKQCGIIRSSIYMRVLGKLDREHSTFKAGQYRLGSGMTTKEIRDILVSGSGVLYKVTFAEGTTLKKMGEILEKSGIVSAEDFIKAASDKELLEEYEIYADSAQGFLFPDSYLFQKNLDAKVVVKEMLRNFYLKIGRLAESGINISSSELYDKVIMASIVQQEYRKREEAPLIASVFYNRLANKMPLSSCATVVYILTEELGHEHPDFLTYDDLKVKSPYNTYKNMGLPPGPISNPGLIALKAVFEPADTDYLYFVLKNTETGEHHFSKKFSDHNAAKKMYIKH